MAEEELLSQEEIDVLLNGVEEGDVDMQASAAASASVGVMAYDLTSQDRIVRGRLPTLEMINERFTRYTRVSMFNLLRETIEVTSAGIENIKFGEYLQMLEMPSSMNMVKIRPLRGTAVFLLNSSLVFTLVDKFFGGGHGDSKVGEREFTPTETRLVQKFLNQVFSDLKEAWKSVMAVDFEFVSTESNPAMVSAISPSEVVVLSTFNIRLGGADGEGGGQGQVAPDSKLQIAIPYSMLEPVRETLDAGLQSDFDDGDAHWGTSLQEDIMYARVPVNCIVAERKITLREILSFKVGDVIPINMPDSNTVIANGVPLFDAQFGKSGANLALKIKGHLTRPDKAS